MDGSPATSKSSHCDLYTKEYTVSRHMQIVKMAPSASLRINSVKIMTYETEFKGEHPISCTSFEAMK